MSENEPQFLKPEKVSKKEDDIKPRERSEKRFILSKEQFAQERIRGIKDTVRELQKEYSEVLGLCLFGSMTKGTVCPESDIDGSFFIDADKVAKKFGFKENDILQNINVELGRAECFKENSELGIPDYGREIREKLQERLNLSLKQIKHITVRPISENIIDQHLDILKRRVEIREYSGPLYPSRNLFPMFHLETGRGIKKCRKYLIDKLIASGETGEKVWKAIIKSTEELEHIRIDTRKRYPRTLKEAQKVYGLRD